MFTRKGKLEVCWKHNTRLMLNLYKIFCNNDATLVRTPDCL
ncbi:hypothetical protein H5410_031582 [Solanum commersonii]|uniref:Uncharacterized protein n=1 Tax=Solanum commersonii TaxID=4109 RepID=A0A9J5YM55_SOLCO|nr:hypothetical protein H5410_031582 [Solanum commersonii]